MYSVVDSAVQICREGVRIRNLPSRLQVSEEIHNAPIIATCARLISNVAHSALALLLITVTLYFNANPTVCSKTLNNLCLYGCDYTESRLLSLSNANSALYQLPSCTCLPTSTFRHYTRECLDHSRAIEACQANILSLEKTQDFPIVLLQLE